MKKITPLTLLVIVGCITIILISVSLLQTSKTAGNDKSLTPAQTPPLSPTPTNLGTWQTIAPAGPGTSVSASGIKGPLIVSIGNYDAKLPVLVDTTTVGEVAKGKPLNISVNEGYHTIRVCSGVVCEQVGVEVRSAIKTTIDFGERLRMALPQGSLTVSNGADDSNLPVYLDNTSVGTVAGSKPLKLMVAEGSHTVRVCAGSVCDQQNVVINSTIPVSVDFGERLSKALPKGPLTVSIGGYNAELPVFIDNTSAGMASTGKPLKLMVSEGRHTVKVCVGVICENEIVDIKFAQPFFVDFGERLKKNVEFSEPTVRIVNSFVTGTSMNVELEFINPDKIDHTMTATIGCGYSFITPNNRERKNNYAQSLITRSVKAGSRLNQGGTIPFTGGSTYIPNEPTIVDVTIN